MVLIILVLFSLDLKLLHSNFKFVLVYFSKLPWAKESVLAVNKTAEPFVRSYLDQLTQIYYDPWTKSNQVRWNSLGNELCVTAKVSDGRALTLTVTK